MNVTDLIVFAGQSNMEGETEGLPPDNSPVENAFEYRMIYDSLVPLKHPVGENLNVNGDEEIIDVTDLPGTLKKCALLAAWENRASMIPAFCRSYIAKTGHTTVAVHTARGCANSELWIPGGVCYEGMCRKIAAAVRKVQPDAVYLAWLQGESDAILGHSGELYKERLIRLNNILRTEFGIKTFGIILVGAFTNDARDLPIIQAQKELCAKNEGFLMLTTLTEQLVHQKECMNPYVAGHFSVLGQEILGTAAGKRLGEFVRTGT